MFRSERLLHSSETTEDDEVRVGLKPIIAVWHNYGIVVTLDEKDLELQLFEWKFHQTFAHHPGVWRDLNSRDAKPGLVVEDVLMGNGFVEDAVGHVASDAVVQMTQAIAFVENVDDGNGGQRDGNVPEGVPK